jgi:hypothetical protein
MCSTSAKPSHLPTTTPLQIKKTYCLNNRTTGSQTTTGLPFVGADTLHLYCTSSFKAHVERLTGGLRSLPEGRVFIVDSRAERGIVVVGGDIV